MEVTLLRCAVVFDRIWNNNRRSRSYWNLKRKNNTLL